MSSVWKNKIFSDTDKHEASSDENNIFRDFNYKNIPDIYDASPPSQSQIAPSNVATTASIVENYEPDTSAVDKDDNIDNNVTVSTNEVIVNNTNENLPTQGDINRFFSKAKKNDVHDTVTETQRYVNDVNAMVNELKSENEKLQGKNFNFDKMYRLIGTAISFPARIFDRTIDLFANLYLNYLNNIQQSYKLDKGKKEYKDLEEIAKLQMKNFMSVIISFWIVVNWWWIMNYTFTYMSFADIFDIPIIKIIMESLLMFVNVVNYCLLGFRQDDYRIVVPEYISVFLWKIRPVAFVFMYLIIQTILMKHKASLDHEFRQAISRVPNSISGFNTFFFFFSFLKMDVLNPVRMMERVNITQSFIVSIFILIFKLLFVLAFLPFGVVFVYLYLIFYSFFGIIAFNGAGIFVALNTMLMDLTNSVPDTNNPNENPLSTLYRIVMNVGIYVGISVIIITILANNVKLINGIKQGNNTYTAMKLVSFFALFAGIMGSLVTIFANLPKNYVEIAKKLAS